MLHVALAGIRARKLRLVLTSVAVVLGVAFVSGAFLLTDSMRASFSDLFEEATAGLAVEVRTNAYREISALQQSGGMQVGVDYQKVGVSQETLEKIRKVDGVKRAVGSFFDMGAQPLKRDGTPIGSQGSPAFLANWEDEAKDARIFTILEGSAPSSGEVMIDTASAKAGKFSVGDKVTILLNGGQKRETYRLSGIVKFGSSSSSFFGAITVLPTKTVQQVLGSEGHFSAVDITSDGSVSNDILKRRVIAALDNDRYHVATGEELGQELNEGVDTGFLSLMQNFILVFAAIAVFVGAFVIFNTFTILVGQRQREFGMLRAIGAGRWQILGIVTLEAVTVGIIASTIGLFAGYVVAEALRSMISAVGVELPKGAFPIELRTVIWCYVVGTLVTLAACLIPAWRSSRLTPLDALRSATIVGKGGWKIPAAGTVLVLVGIILVILGFTASSDASTKSILLRIGIGLATIVLGVTLQFRLIIAPIVRLLASVFARGVSGSLARGNVLRNRARSSTTAAALMIGLSIATLALVFQASVSATIDQQITKSIGSDIVAYNRLAQQGQSAFVSDRQFDTLRNVDGVTNIAGLRQGSFQIGKTFKTDSIGLSEYMIGIDSDQISKNGLLRIDVTTGSRDLGDGILVARDVAKEKGWKVGDKITIATAGSPATELQITGLFSGNQVTGQWIVSTETFDKIQPPALHGYAMVMANVEKGKDPGAVAKQMSKALGRDAKLIDIKDNDALRQQAEDQFGFIIGVVMAMLFLSLIIATFGIANTLALNVFERTREIGLLRAVGTTQRQTRRMIRIEAVLIAVFGAIIGVLVGVAGGAALVSALDDEGFVFAVKIVPIVLVLIGGLIAGLLSSILPARRASRMNVLNAIATE